MCIHCVDILLITFHCVYMCRGILNPPNVCFNVMCECRREMHRCYVDSPLYRLHVVQKGAKATSAFEDHRPKAPVVHSYSVGFTLKQLWSLQIDVLTGLEF